MATSTSYSDQTLYGNLNVTGAITSFLNQVPTDPYGELVVTQRTSVIDIKSVFGLSNLRDAVTTTGTGSVTGTLGQPEFVISTGTGTTDSAKMQSTERGRYIAGFGAQQGMAIRIPSVFTGNQSVRWGYSDLANGFLWLYTSTGMAVSYIRNNVETITTQSNWNVDKLDGTGPSGLILDVARGNIWRINFSWYGYGAVIWSVVLTSNTGSQVVQTVHKYAPTGQTSVLTPNQPIIVSLANGGTGSAQTVYLAGRQFSLYSHTYSPSYRITSGYIASAAISGTSTKFVPLMTFQRKANTAGVGTKIASFDVITSGTVILEIRVAGTLTGASYGNLPDTPSGESLLQFDTSATAITGGIVIYTALISVNTSTSASTFNSDSIDFVISDYQPITYCVFGVGGTNNITVSAVARLREEW